LQASLDDLKHHLNLYGDAGDALLIRKSATDAPGKRLQREFWGSIAAISPFTSAT